MVCRSVVTANTDGGSPQTSSAGSLSHVSCVLLAVDNVEGALTGASD